MSPTKLKVLDDRPILARGEGPYQRIGAKVASLAPEQDLTVIAPFLPALLIEVLKREGFTSSLELLPDYPF